jgi:hypothetical protein
VPPSSATILLQQHRVTSFWSEFTITNPVKRWECRLNCLDLTKLCTGKRTAEGSNMAHRSRVHFSKPVDVPRTRAKSEPMHKRCRATAIVSTSRIAKMTKESGGSRRTTVACRKLFLGMAGGSLYQFSDGGSKIPWAGALSIFYRPRLQARWGPSPQAADLRKLNAASNARFGHNAEISARCGVA